MTVGWSKDRAVGGLMAAALLAGCAGSGPTGAAPAPSLSGPSNTYLQSEPGEQHLRNIRQLSFGGNNAESYFSRSGKQLVFQRQVEVGVACDQEYIMNIDGSGMRRISNGQGRTTCGFFYDNDRRVLYSSTFTNDPACPAPPDQSKGYVWPIGHLEIYSSKTNGSELRALTSNGAYNAEATVSSDGRKIIFTSTKDGDIELYTMNIDGTGVRRITNRLGYDGGAFFSPDGKRLVWRAMYPETAADSAEYGRLLAQWLVRPSRLELWVADVDGSNPRQVTRLGAASFAPFFHPDGRRIVFASNHPDPRGRNFDLYLVGVDGSGLERVTTSAEFDGFPMFSPDGRRLVFASNRHGRERGETNIFIADWVE